MQAEFAPMKKSVLIIDDEKLFRDLMYDIFINGEYDVTCVASGIEALSLPYFDLYIVDLGLPGPDGLKTIEKLQKKFSRRIDAFLITGYDRQYTAEFLQARGIRHVLQKPFDIADLKRLIKLHFTEKDIKESK